MAWRASVAAAGLDRANETQASVPPITKKGFSSWLISTEVWSALGARPSARNVDVKRCFGLGALLAARIVLGIDVNYIERSHSVDLYDRLTIG